MTVVGIDEVGRGCWAGPLLAAAVILDAPIPGLMDSKLLNKSRRESLDLEIRKHARAFGIGWVSPEDVDKFGVTLAVGTAMKLALEAINEPIDKIIVDGNINYFSADARAQAIIKADMTIPSVSAASIIAKVARDNYMAQQAREFPEYGFEKHVGYGTKMHSDALKLHGVTSIHRKSYKPIKALLELN